MERGDTSTRVAPVVPLVHWDANHIKALLHFQLEKLPALHLVWLKQHGGAEALVWSFRDYPLSPIQRTVLTRIVAEPGHPHLWYAVRLNIHRSTFSEWLGDLARRLATLLNMRHAGVSHADGCPPTRGSRATMLPFPGVAGGREHELVQIQRTLAEVQELLHEVERRLASLQGDR